MEGDSVDGAASKRSAVGTVVAAKLRVLVFQRSAGAGKWRQRSGASHRDRILVHAQADECANRDHSILPRRNGWVSRSSAESRRLRGGGFHPTFSPAATAAAGYGQRLSASPRPATCGRSIPGLDNATRSHIWPQLRSIDWPRCCQSPPNNSLTTHSTCYRIRRSPSTHELDSRSLSIWPAVIEAGHTSSAAMRAKFLWPHCSASELNFHGFRVIIDAD